MARCGMNRRPRSISIIGCIFIAVGCIAFVAGVRRLLHAGASDIGSTLSIQSLVDFGLMTVSNVLAIVGGAFLLRGLNWARWLCAVWMGFHIILSMMHSVSELAVHCLIFGVVAWFLFRPTASTYFEARV